MDPMDCSVDILGMVEVGVPLVVGPTDIDPTGDGVVTLGEVLALVLGVLTIKINKPYTLLRQQHPFSP